VAENVKRQSFNLSKANNPGGGAAVHAVLLVLFIWNFNVRTETEKGRKLC